MDKFIIDKSKYERVRIKKLLNLETYCSTSFLSVVVNSKGSPVILEAVLFCIRAN